MELKKISFGFWLMVLLFTGMPRVGRTIDGGASEFKEVVYLTKNEALEQMFGENLEVREETYVLSKKEKKQLEEKLGRRLKEESFDVLRCFRGGRFLGDAVITEEIGLFKMITFMVSVDPEDRVKRAAVLTYREPRGMEVRRRRFLKQYEGKTVDDPIALNRDIIHITGATLSSRALSAGVKKILYFIVEVYRPKRPLKEKETAEH